MNTTWFENFFEGLATDVWRNTIEARQTAEELEFIEEHLDLGSGDRVLDVPCSDGRLALPLAQKGIHVTGIDLSPRCLTAAKAEAAKGLPLEYIQRDMRELDYQDNFDGAFCMGNSFGYFNADDTIKFLAGICNALKPGAKFILDTCLSAETFFTVGGTKEWVEAEGIIMLMENTYHPRESRLDSRFMFLHGPTTEEHTTHHWIFTAGEICRMCEQVGFEIVELFGSVHNDRFELGADRLLLLARKPVSR